MASIKQILSALLALGSASAAIIPRQQGDLAGSFSINSFQVGAYASSPDAIYSFEIADTSATASNFSTSCFATTPTSPGLGNFPSTPCDDPTVTFDFGFNGTDYVMNIQHQWGMDVQHAIVLAHDDFTDTAVIYWHQDRLVNGGQGDEFVAQIDSVSEFDAEYGRYS